MSLKNLPDKILPFTKEPFQARNLSRSNVIMIPHVKDPLHDPVLSAPPPEVLEHPIFQDEGPPPLQENNSNSVLMSVLVPIVCLCFLVILTFTAHRTWKRYGSFARARRSRQISNRPNCASVEAAHYEETEPLSGIAVATNNNTNIGLINDNSDMQLVHEAERNSRSDCEDVHDGLMASEGSSPSSDVPREDETPIAVKPSPVYAKLRLEAPCERPKTLKFLAASVAFQGSTVPALKRLPYTPDPDYDQYSTVCNTAAEVDDKIAPLGKGRMKLRSKPRGLLERRGSNVALTISLKAGEKANASNPVASKSPKPLAYLQQASSPLDPEEVHTKACDPLRLQQEFWEIPMNHPPEKNFNVAGHGTKNRYRSILPNEHSRVTLDPCTDDDALSTYINANYIRDCAKPAQGRTKVEDISSPVTRRDAAFIATQGPMANTIGDFWRMTWQENVRCIVMITKLKERKEKCSPYLPMNLDESATYDDVTVSVDSLRQFEHFTLRTLSLRHSNGERRAVQHYWYTTWMDHETPEKTRGLLELVQEVTRWNSEQHGPTVVHCSAGIGRTGCFIAVRAGCQQLLENGKVDILRIVSQMRLDRGGMIQTWEQYQFVHQALSRYARILAGENVTTPSTTGSIRSPPGPIGGGGTPKQQQQPAPVETQRPSTPKHRRSLSDNNSLPASKGIKVCQKSEGGSPAPQEKRGPKRKPKLRLGKLRDISTAPSSPLPQEEAPSPRLVVVKSVSSPTIRSPFARLCLQAKDLNRSASPASSVKFEWPDPTKSSSQEERLPSSRGGRKSNENDLTIEVPPSPACNPSPTQLGRFSFDLVAARSGLCNGSNPPSPFCEKTPPGSAKSTTPRAGVPTTCSRFVFPGAEAR